MVFTLFKLLDVKSVQSVSFATNFFYFFLQQVIHNCFESVFLLITEVSTNFKVKATNI